MKSIKWLFILIAILLSPTLTTYALDCLIVKVTDGDTVLVQHEDLKFKIRIAGINTPERGKPFYKESKLFTTKMLLGKKVKIKQVGIGSWNRTLAFIYIDGNDIGQMLLDRKLAEIYSGKMKYELPRGYSKYKEQK